MDPASAIQHILIVADIEGSSGCWGYEGSAFMTRDWVGACEAMTADVGAVARALLNAGVRTVTVKDFHRSGYNLLPARLPATVRVISGYQIGPVPGMGAPPAAEAVMFLGMHAASGTHGFLAHTLTSRLSDIRVNGSILPEIQLFAASLAPFGMGPLFFSGCPEACRQARAVAPGLTTYAIDKSRGLDGFDAHAWRQGLAAAAVATLDKRPSRVVLPEGPLHTVVTMRDGAAAAAGIARRWGMKRDNDRLFFEAVDIHHLYRELIRICYLTPWIENRLGWLLPLFNLKGRLGMMWVRRQIRSGTHGRRKQFAAVRTDKSGLQ